MCGFVGGSVSLKIGFQVSKASVHSAPHHGDVLISKTLSDPLIRCPLLKKLSWTWLLIGQQTLTSVYICTFVLHAYFFYSSL